MSVFGVANNKGMGLGSARHQRLKVMSLSGQRATGSGKLETYLGVWESTIELERFFRKDYWFVVFGFAINNLRGLCFFSLPGTL